MDCRFEQCQLDLINGTPNNIYNLAFAVFQNAAGTVTVNQSAGAVGVTGMLFASNGYRIQGDPITLHDTGGQTLILVGDGTVAGSGMTATIASALTGASQWSGRPGHAGAVGQ